MYRKNWSIEWLTVTNFYFQYLRHVDEDHKCLIKNRSEETVADEGRDTVSEVRHSGRVRPVRQAVVRRVRDQARNRRGRRRRGATAHQHQASPQESQQLQPETPQGGQHEQQQQQQEPQIVQEIPNQPEENILTVQAGESISHVDGDADTQNVEIIYIPFSLPLSRPMQAELMRAMSSEEQGHIGNEILEGGPTITLDTSASSLLVGNSTMVPLVSSATVSEVDPLETSDILKESSELQVIYHAAPPQQGSDDPTTHLVSTPLTNDHIHSSQLSHDAATLEDSQLAHTHLTHLNILPDQTWYDDAQ